MIMLEVFEANKITYDEANEIFERYADLKENGELLLSLSKFMNMAIANNYFSASSQDRFMDENKDKEIDFDIVRSNFDDFTDIIKQRFISIKMLNKLWENRINHCNNKAPKQEYSDKCIFNCKLVFWMLIKFLKIGRAHV